MNLKPLIQFFEANPDVGVVVCEFDGSSDSGSIQDVRGLPKLSPRRLNDHYHTEPVASAVDALQAIRSDMEDMTCGVLEMQGLNWKNDEGGYGLVAFWRDGAIRAYSNERYTETHLIVSDFRFDQLLTDQDIALVVTPEPATTID